jgi:hypothetical protein
MILPGNNSELVKKCMAHRINWKECSNSQMQSTLFHFRWQSISTGIDFPNLNKLPHYKQTVNHLEFHPVISNKMNLFINLMKYCEKNNLEIFAYIPFTIIAQYDSPSFLQQWESFKTLFDNIKNHLFNRVNPVESVNRESQHLKKYGSIFKLGMYNDKLGLKTSSFINSTHYEGKNMWLIKAIDLNRGRCIKIADNPEKIKEIIKKFYEGIFRELKNQMQDEQENANTQNKKKKKNKHDFRKYRASCVILQKYIEQPLLYYGRKFDIRMWVMYTHKEEAYCFREGHLKTSSLNYNINDTSDTFIHLTNYSVQKYNKEFGRYEIGNEVSFKDFQTFLDKEYGEGIVTVQGHIMRKIKTLIQLTFSAVKDSINSNNRKNCFEIFGFDFIIDKNLDISILEVNTNPGLEESSPLIRQLVPRMIDDALKLTIDDIYETKYQQYVDINGDKSFIKSPYPVEGYNDSENLW